MYKKIFNFFDKLEDKVRARLSRHPIVYSFIGGIAIVVFWKGVWDISDAVSSYFYLKAWSEADTHLIFSGLVAIALSAAALMVTGLFTSFFVGDVIIISGIKKEKKLAEKTEGEISEEASSLERIENVLEKIEGEIQELKK